MWKVKRQVTGNFAVDDFNTDVSIEGDTVEIQFGDVRDGQYVTIYMTLQQYEDFVAFNKAMAFQAGG